MEFDYEVDATGRAISVSELDGRTTTWTYDDSKRLIREEVSGQQGQNYWVNYQYNAVGSRIREVHSQNGERIFAYDSNDRLTTITASLGVTRYTFDNNGNLLGEVAPSASKSYRWNEQNELIEQTIDAAGTTTVLKFSYDAAGRRIRYSLERTCIAEHVFSTTKAVQFKQRLATTHSATL